MLRRLSHPLSVFTTPLLGLLVLAGLAGFAVIHARAAGDNVPRHGAFWTLKSRGATDGGAAAGVKRDTSAPGLYLGPGDVLRLTDEDGPRSRLQRVRLLAQREGNQSSYVRILFRHAGSELDRLLVLVGPTVEASLSRQSEGDDFLFLDRLRERVAVADPSAPYLLELALDGARLEVRLNDQRILAADEPAPPDGHCAIYADGVRLLRLEVEGSALDGEAGEGDPAPVGALEGASAFHRSTDFTRETPDAAGAASLPRAALLEGLGLGLLAVLVAAAWLRVLCPGRPPPGRLLRATLLFLAPPALLVAVLPFVDVPRAGALAALLAGGGLLTAAFVLRPQLFATPADSAPRAAGPRSVVRPALVVLVLGGTAVWSAVERHARADAPLVAEARQSLAGLSPRAFTLTAPQRLDAGTAVSVPGSARSLQLRAALTVDAGSWIEFRLRGRPGIATGVALFLSTREDAPTGFVLEEDDDFRPIGTGSGPVPAGRELQLELRATGPHFEAFVDGERVASTTAWSCPAGSLTVLAASGTATLSALSVEPLVPEPAVEAGWWATLAANPQAAAAPLLLLLATTLLAVGLLRVPPGRAAETCSFALLPLAALVAADGRRGRLLDATFGLAAAAGIGLLLVVALVHAHRCGVLRATAFALLAAPAVIVALLLQTGRPCASLSLAGPSWDQCGWPQTAPDLLHVQHPVLRRLNTWLADHRFRGRAFDVVKPPGTLRVLCLGTSSTWGHGIEEALRLDYPAVLESRLAERLAPARVEVLNAGVRNSTSARLLRFLRDALLDFAPDVVTVSLTYNDTIYLSQFDEGRHLAGLERSGDADSWLAQRSVQRELAAGRDVLAGLNAPERKPGADRDAAWRALVPGAGVRTPVERFEANLRELAGLLRDRGIDVVLIREPVRGDADTLWKSEFHAVLERVGADLGLPVVDPAPALAAAGGAALFMDAVHPLPRGHEVVADTLAPVLEPILRRRAAAGGR